MPGRFGRAGQFLGGKVKPLPGPSRVLAEPPRRKKYSLVVPKCVCFVFEAQTRR